jgi:chromosome segregation ATPase
MQQERDSLRAEVTQLRKSLESLQEKHGEEISGVKEELEQSRQGKEHAETQYRNLLTKVNTIRSQLGERLKADAAELEQARERIEELESSDRVVKEDNERLQQQVSELNANLEAHAAELETLRSRTTLSTSNWARERDDLLSQQAYLKEEYEVAKQAMQDWEILATDEKSRREALEDRMQGLEEQLHAQRDAYERIQSESELQNNTVDGLQRALRDLQEERKRELREMVEQSQAQLESLRTQTQKAEETAAELKSQLESTQKELERTAPFEKEVKEKNLLIGKLRHEAVILNDHLTKALRFLKRGKPEDNVDRQLVTNHFLHFLELDRSDPKKFQILGLIAALLGWDDQQKEQAGLVRQGTSASGTGLRVPMSPFRRTPSTPQLGEFVPESPGGASRETLAELWSDFLEREAEQGSGKGHSRRTSVTSNKSNSFRSPSMGALMSPVSERGGGPPLRSPGLQRQDSSDTTTTTATK